MIYIALFVIGMLAWIISTVAAGGAATLLIPIVGFLLGPQLVAPVISVASIIANPSRIVFFFPYIDWSVIRYLLPGSVLGAVIGSWSFTRLEVDGLQIVFGVFLIAYVLQRLYLPISIPFRMKAAGFFPLGILIAFLSGLVGATGPVLNPFLLNYGLDRQHLVATKSMNSFVMQFTKLGTYTIFGALTLHTAAYGVMLGLGAMLGVYYARHHLLRIDRDRFFRYIYILMFASGVVMLFKAFA